MESRFEKTGSAVAAWWQRRSRGVLLPVPDPTGAGERRQPDEWPASLPFRKRPKPYSRAIAWQPAARHRPVPASSRLRGEHERSQPYELFVAQSVLREVRAHLIGSPNSEPYGFLLGHVVYCPWTRAPYVVIDAARRETQDAPHSGETDAFRRSWASASREARRRRGQIIGWYHQHGVLGLRLSQSDLRLQEEFFPEAWHCALLIVPGKDGVVGGFIQRTGRASLYRKGISGFFELIDLDAKLIDGKKPSVVDWTNYRAEEQVEVVPVMWPVPRRRPHLVPDEPTVEGNESPTLADAEPARETEVEAARGRDVGKPQHGLTARRWKPRSSPSPKASAAEPRPGARGDPASSVGGTKERTSKSKSAEKAAPPGEEQTASATDPSDEFREAIGPMSPEPDEAPAGSRPARPPLDADDGQVAEFLEAIWGPPPFDPEPNDGPVMRLPLHRELMPVDRPELRAAVEPASVQPPGLNGPFRAEPAEPDSAPGSLDWLLGLVEETIGSRRVSAGETDPARSEAPTEASEAMPGPGIDPAVPEREDSAARPDAPAAVKPPDAAAAVAPSDPAVAGVPRRSGDPRRPAPPMVATRGEGRFTFVGVSQDPDEDSEAEIPVVMPPEDGVQWLPWIRRHRNRALIAAAVVIAALSAWLVLGREEPGRPAFRTPAQIAPSASRAPAQGPEFIRLSGEFSAALAAYRERAADFQLGRIDCAGLATGYETLTTAFSALSEYVALAPSGSVDFSPFADDMREARVGFEGSGCESAQSRPGGSTS